MGAWWAPGLHLLAVLAFVPLWAHHGLSMVRLRGFSREGALMDHSSRSMSQDKASGSPWWDSGDFQSDCHRHCCCHCCHCCYHRAPWWPIGGIGQNQATLALPAYEGATTFALAIGGGKALLGSHYVHDVVLLEIALCWSNGGWSKGTLRYKVFIPKLK